MILYYRDDNQVYDHHNHQPTLTNTSLAVKSYKFPRQRHNHHHYCLFFAVWLRYEIAKLKIAKAENSQIFLLFSIYFNWLFSALAIFILAISTHNQFSVIMKRILELDYSILELDYSIIRIIYRFIVFNIILLKNKIYWMVIRCNEHIVLFYFFEFVISLIKTSEFTTTTKITTIIIIPIWTILITEF